MNDGSKKPFVIGLTGSIGSGCTTLSKGLEAQGFKRTSISSFIKKKFKKLHPETTLKDFGQDWRAELQEIGNRGRRGEFATNKVKNGDYRSYWIDLALAGVDTAEQIVIVGIRNIGEVNALRQKFPQFWLVAVYADYKIRWERIKDSGSYLNEKVFERDDRRDSGEDESYGQSVQRCVYEADYVLKNDKLIGPARIVGSSLAETLARQFDGMKTEKKFRDPFQREVFMATAVSQSHASHCLKRKVGALIVNDENGIPLSVGYNDNPVGMESCFSRYNGQCYKEMVIERKLDKMVPFFCPECGKKHKTIKPPWTCDKKKSDNRHCRCNFRTRFFPSRNIELCTAIHAEERAIRSLGQRSAEGCTIYVNTFPCFQCARHIVDAGIKKVVYIEAYPIEEAVQFLMDNKIGIEPFEGFTPRVFNKVFRQIE